MGLHPTSRVGVAPGVGDKMSTSRYFHLHVHKWGVFPREIPFLVSLPELCNTFFYVGLPPQITLNAFDWIIYQVSVHETRGAQTEHCSERAIPSSLYVLLSQHCNTSPPSRSQARKLCSGFLGSSQWPRAPPSPIQVCLLLCTYTVQKQW